MEKKVYAVMGASGNVGGQVARRLLEAGMEVRVIGRNADKMKSLTGKGAKFYATAADNAVALTEAFKGASGIFVMIPPNLQAQNIRQEQNKVADAITEAIQRSGVKHVVALSSIGAQNAEGVGPVKGLHDFEVRLKKLQNVNVRVLRCAFFMENTLSWIPLIQTMGVAGSPAPGDCPIPMIATRDIGDRVADRLLKLDFQGYTVQYALGQRDVSLKDAARILGEAIGKKDLAYTQFPPDQAIAGMMQMGMSQDVAKNMVELMLAGKLMAPTEPRSAQNTTPTSIEAFAQEFANRFRQPASTKA